MKKAFPLLIMPFLLFLFGCNRDGEGLEECENFQFLGALYQDEKLTIKFNSKVIYDDFFKKKTTITFERLCVDYTDTFNVSIKVVKGDRTVVDTSMVGYAKYGKYLLRLPRGDPKPHLVETVWADTTGTLYNQIPTDSLLRKAFLEPKLIVTD
jgi:hypothetical protein